MTTICAECKHMSKNNKVDPKLYLCIASPEKAKEEDVLITGPYLNSGSFYYCKGINKGNCSKFEKRGSFLSRQFRKPSPKETLVRPVYPPENQPGKE